jgi:hypothetical protein
MTGILLILLGILNCSNAFIAPFITSLNPEWVKTVDMTYCFEETQHVLIELYDSDDNKAK